MKLQEFRTRLEDFEERVARELLHHCAGRSQSLQIASIYSDFRDICVPDAYRDINREIDQTPDWRAGRFLKEIWETGQMYTTDEMSREIGLGPIEPHLLTAGFREGLSL
jgi:hypothetical protein